MFAYVNILHIKIPKTLEAKQLVRCEEMNEQMEIGVIYR